MAVDWQTIGTGVGLVVSNAITYFVSRGRREVKAASDEAERDVVLLLRQEVQRLSERLTAMEGREGRLIRHVYRLEGLMRAKDIEPPPFDIDGSGLA